MTREVLEVGAEAKSPISRQPQGCRIIFHRERAQFALIIAEAADLSARSPASQEEAKFFTYKPRGTPREKFFLSLQAQLEQITLFT